MPLMRACLPIRTLLLKMWSAATCILRFMVFRNNRFAMPYEHFQYFSRILGILNSLIKADIDKHGHLVDFCDFALDLSIDRREDHVDLLAIIKNIGFLISKNFRIDSE